MSVKTDGTAMYIDWGNNTNVFGLTKKTIIFWIKQTTFQAGTVLRLSNTSSPGTNENVNVTVKNTSDGDFGYSASFTTTDGIWRIAASSMALNSLYQAAIVHDGTGLTAPTLYLNAVSKTVTTVQAPVGTLRSTGANSQLTNGRPTSTLSPIGSIQDIRIYNVLKTAAQIATLYGNGVPNSLELDDGNLVFHAPLMYAAGLYPTVPFAGTLSGTSYTYDRVNSVQGIPTGSPSGNSDMVYGSAF